MDTEYWFGGPISAQFEITVKHAENAQFPKADVFADGKPIGTAYQMPGGWTGYYDVSMTEEPGVCSQDKRDGRNYYHMPTRGFSSADGAAWLLGQMHAAHVKDCAGCARVWS